MCGSIALFKRTWSGYWNLQRRNKKLDVFHETPNYYTFLDARFANQVGIFRRRLKLNASLHICSITVNIFNNMRERQWTEVKDKFEYFPRVWFRYVDDIFAVFDTKAISLDNFVAKLNNRFPTIKFTYEVEQNEQIPFLDVLVIRNSENKNVTNSRQLDAFESLEIIKCNNSMNKDNGPIPTSPLFALINKDSYGSVNRGNKFEHEKIREPVAEQNVCGYYNTIERIGGHGQIGMRIGVMQSGAIVYLLTKQDLICFTPMAEC
ncbi:hypothetical protein NQ318_003114 [Aromia moschata]|uniref:Reverse transcriptase domain-containing protein n=1 Tax=Aromia moschata TaxID=1265417 RepID=A0AAV8YSE0_9CUCU|nr:hypothetical protein NQ318_003114 [Aromia moschata]